ncbi:DUF4352 domain-containing protein [Actinomadura verrucosospora]|uniref:Mpr protein n=1 Tax=Actinomadura verrucosospora TaxID=46165 RepID=A0A7D3VTN7_ACTVE|nr:DUF4352 domain-containing protein [Actinomadura verrucosospora]QKG20514.1 Mpr protein [Actinomadura verrucosospora]
MATDQPNAPRPVPPAVPPPGVIPPPPGHFPHYNGPVPPPGYPPPRQKGKGCLYAVIGTVATLFLMGACGVIVGATADSPSATPTTSHTPSAPKASSPRSMPSRTAKATTSKTAVVNGIGREYRDGKFAFTVTKVKKGVKRVGDEYFGSTAQGQYVLISVTVENIGDKARTFTAGNQTLYDTKGRKFDTDGGATVMMGDESKSFLEQINPGNSVDGILIFDVPRGIRLKALDLHDSVFSGGVTVPLGNR